MNLKSKYLGFELKSPIVVSASPLSEDISKIKKMEDSGASAVVLYSLFEEQLLADQKEMFFRSESNLDTSAEASGYFPDLGEYKMGPEEYLNHVAKAKEAVDIPIIASLNGYTTSGWTEFAKKIQSAGADALELNIYDVPTNFGIDSLEIEQNYLEIISNVKKNVSIPVAVKLSPFFSSLANFAKKIDDLNIDGLTLFNRFYQPDIDLDKLELAPNVLYSSEQELRIPLRWIGILSGNIKASLAATGGIHKPEDIIKSVLVGADCAMLASILLIKGVEHIDTLEKGIIRWMEEKEYESIEQMKGSMNQKKSGNPKAFERAQYIKALTSY